jgi:hypothetical protein
MREILQRQSQDPFSTLRTVEQHGSRRAFANPKISSDDVGVGRAAGRRQAFSLCKSSEWFPWCAIGNVGPSLGAFPGADLNTLPAASSQFNPTDTLTGQPSKQVPRLHRGRAIVLALASSIPRPEPSGADMKRREFITLAGARQPLGHL